MPDAQKIRPSEQLAEAASAWNGILADELSPKDRRAVEDRCAEIEASIEGGPTAAFVAGMLTASGMITAVSKAQPLRAIFEQTLGGPNGVGLTILLSSCMAARILEGRAAEGC